MRRAVAGNRDIPPPGKIDAGGAQLRKNPEHSSLQRARQPVRLERGVTNPAAKQHAIVGRQTIVVQHQVGVSHRRAVGDQTGNDLLPQRLGGDNIGSHRHNHLCQMRLQAAEIRIAGIHHLVAGNRAKLGVDSGGRCAGRCAGRCG